MTTKTPIKPRKLSQEIEARLLEMIEGDNLGPGDFIPSERQLMAQFEVGRPAVREAMQNLERMGLIEIRHGGRPRVAAPAMEDLIKQLGTSIRHLLVHSKSSLDHMKEARISLEAGMANLAAERCSAADLEDLAQILTKQEAAREDTKQFMALDGDFHARVAEISRNPIFSLVVQAVFDWLKEFHVDHVSKPGLEDLTMAEHRAIFDAIKAGDGPSAARTMREHLSRADSLYHRNNIQK